jgi:hypothetical protein
MMSASCEFAPGGCAMYFISKSELSFAEISEYWAPELRWSRDMVQAILEGAWWLGEILTYFPQLPLRMAA